MSSEIIGYPKLSGWEVFDINSCKLLEQKVMDLLGKLKATPQYDSRMLVIAEANLEQGFMWAVKSIARPYRDKDSDQ